MASSRPEFNVGVVSIRDAAHLHVLRIWGRRVDVVAMVAFNALQHVSCKPKQPFEIARPATHFDVIY